MGEFDDADLDGVLAAIDVDNEIANPQLDGGDVKSKSKKSRAKDAKPKREPPKMIRAPDGSSFGTCEACGKRCAAAMLTQYGGFGHECEEVDPTIKLKELAAKERARKDAAKDKFDAAKAAARRELAAREVRRVRLGAAALYEHDAAARLQRVRNARERRRAPRVAPTSGRAPRRPPRAAGARAAVQAQIVLPALLRMAARQTQGGKARP